MEKLRASLAAKIIAMALVVISVISLLACFAGMMIMDAAGVYRLRKEDLLREGYEEICRRYSAAAIAGCLGEYDAEELLQTNFRYGVVQEDDLESVDFSDLDSYIAGNFEAAPDKKDLVFEEYEISEDTEFVIGNGSILDAYDRVYTDTYSNIAYSISGWFYDRDTDTFYVRSEDSLFPVPAEDGELILSENWERTPLRDAGDYIMENGSQKYEWQEYDTVSFYGETILLDLKDVRIVDTAQLLKYGEIQEESPDYFETQTFYISRRNPTAHYIVASYVNLPLAGAQSFADGDRFVQAKILVELAYRIRYAVIVVLILSLVILLAAFAFLMASAGYRKGQEGICPHFMDHVPLDLYFTGVLLTEVFGVYLVVASVDSMLGSRSRNTLSSGFVSAAVIIVCAGILEVLLGIAWCMSFAVRVKIGKWWQHTLVYMILRKCVHLLAKVMHFCGYTILSLCRSISLLWKAWLVLGLLAFVEFAVLEACWAGGQLMFYWMMEKIILYPVLILLLMQMNKLQKGAKQIADGQLNYQIDTRHMFWEVKKHGEYLNDIGHGINCAVNERMKSEHFKTELITNVSHDIKTPLTSIINYVDLLQKEEIDNPTVQEYLEVLHRQSARLKKLIEDLMEASKASTGSLSVVMEKCDAGVMLVQTIGEFEEKLMAEQIELQIKKPEADILIEADHRHLWRVFDNLMNNICKYAQPLTRAYVNLDQNGQQAVVTFRNISKYQLNISSEELMERFVRGDSSRNTEGSGLGISIAKSLTELMDGTFDLVVDGDLFKVVLTFPLYGAAKIRRDSGMQNKMQKQDFEGSDFTKQEKRGAGVLGGLAAGIQNAGSHAAEFGQGAADKTRRIFHRAGRFAHHVRQAAEQVKAEEAAELYAERQSTVETNADFMRETEHQN